ncbi:unnamed protein product [Urochloa humidicola]
MKRCSPRCQASPRRRLCRRASPRRHHRPSSGLPAPPPSLGLPALVAPPPSLVAGPPRAAAASPRLTRRDRTADLPEELLDLIFGLIGSADRKFCSLIWHRWLTSSTPRQPPISSSRSTPGQRSSPRCCEPATLRAVLGRLQSSRSSATPAPRASVTPSRSSRAPRPRLHRLKLCSLPAVADDIPIHQSAKGFPVGSGLLDWSLCGL